MDEEADVAGCWSSPRQAVTKPKASSCPTRLHAVSDALHIVRWMQLSIVDVRDWSILFPRSIPRAGRWARRWRLVIVRVVNVQSPRGLFELLGECAVDWVLVQGGESDSCRGAIQEVSSL